MYAIKSPRIIYLILHFKNAGVLQVNALLAQASKSQFIDEAV